MKSMMPIPGRPLNILPPGQGPDGKYTKADIPKLKEVLNEVQRQLEKLRIATKGLYVPAEDQLVRVIDELQNGIALLENNKAISNDPRKYNVTNNPDSANISYKTGDVSSGSNVGSGTVNNENVIGRVEIIINHIGCWPKGLIEFLQTFKPRNRYTIKKKKNKWQF